MMKYIVSLSLLLASCQTVQRVPASQDQAELLREELTVQLIREKLEILNLQVRNQNPEATDPSNVAGQVSSLQSIMDQKQALINTAKAARTQQLQGQMVSAPQSEVYGFRDKWRSAEEIFVLPHTNFAKPDASGKFKTYFVNDLEARSIVVNLRHRTLMKEKDLESGDSDRPFLDTSITCREPYTVNEGGLTKKLRANESTSVKWYDQLIGSEVTLAFAEKFTSCTIRFKKPDSKDVFGFQLAPESQMLNSLEFVQNNSGTCYLPSAATFGPLEQLFVNNAQGNFTCPKKVNKIRSLEKTSDAINARAKALLGYEFTKEQLDGSNPYFKFDMSKAPKLDAIFISSLIFRGDFYGMLVLRMLEEQAARGAQVRIMVSDSTSKEGALWRLWDVIAAQPNIKLVSFKYKPQGTTVSDMFSKFHRSMHTKLMMTYSKDHPEFNTAIFGGRNYADSYAFKEPKNLSKYPMLTQYSNSDWLYFEDYEMEVQDPALVRELMSQYLIFYNIDQLSMHARNTNVGITAGKATAEYFQLQSNQGLVRHLMSFPFRGDDSLENFYVKVFDSAQKTIKISSPYFSPTKRIGEAMERAAGRGVKVEAITGMSFDGDTAGDFLGEVNKTASNKFLKKISMYSYAEPKTVLHAKLMIIDDRVSLVGSVNLNQRSFYHDSKNVLMIYSPEYSKYLSTYFDGYKQRATHLTEPAKAVYWKKIITGLFKKDF
jgi:putative cardiolipin synthase